MFALGVLLTGMGAPMLALGIAFRMSAKTEAAKQANEKTKTRAKKTKGKKDKKDKKGKKGNRDKDQPGKERGTSGGVSLIIGGFLTTVAGIVFLVRHFMQQ